MAGKTKYRDTIYNAYVSLRSERTKKKSTEYSTYARVLDWRLKDSLPENRDIAYADLACGSGELLYWAKTKGIRDISGVDISPEQVALARQVCNNVTQSDVFEFLSSGKQFDLITAFSIIEHLVKDEALDFLTAVFNSLTPGGMLVLLTPNADSPFASHMRYGDVTHETLYNQHSLKCLLKACGFADFRAFQTGPVPHGLVSCIRWLAWRSIAGLLKTYRLIEGGSARGWLFTTEFIMICKKPESGE